MSGTRSQGWKIASVESPATQRDIVVMERKLQVNEKLYLYLLEARAQNVISRAGIAPQASIIEIARNSGIIGPDKRQTIRNYSLYGALIALAIAFARMLLFDRLESTQELREVTQLPVVAGLPHYADIDAPSAGHLGGLQGPDHGGVSKPKDQSSVLALPGGSQYNFGEFSAPGRGKVIRLLQPGDGTGQNRQKGRSSGF